MSIKLKPITEKSWLVLGDTEENRIGLLTEIMDQYTLMIKGVKQQFLNRKEVNKYFKEDVFDNVVIEVERDPKTTHFINGFPVDFNNPCEVSMTGTTLPLFSKKPESEIYYSAGYFCLQFPKNWMPAYNPKLSTLQTYTYAGPFKDELSMRTSLTKLRKEKQ